MMTKYQVTVIAPDGDSRTEGEFVDIEDAWEYIADMGSRWFFYPISTVSSDGVIVDTPIEFPYLQGMDISDLASVANEMTETCEMLS